MHNTRRKKNMKSVYEKKRWMRIVGGKNKKKKNESHKEC